jgi:hypothetical protein
LITFILFLINPNALFAQAERKLCDGRSPVMPQGRRRTDVGHVWWHPGLAARHSAVLNRLRLCKLPQQGKLSGDLRVIAAIIAVS